LTVWGTEYTINKLHKKKNYCRPQVHCEEWLGWEVTCGFSTFIGNHNLF
jgi:hypothetical protein